MPLVQGKGTLLQHGVAGTPIVYTTIAKRVSISGPEMSVAEIDATDLDSLAMESEPGLPDAGSISLTINYDPESATHQLLFDLVFTPTVELWQLVTKDGTKFPFSGWLSKFSPTGMEVNGKLTADIEIRVTGVIEPTYPA
jgi:hypothetical protein